MSISKLLPIALIIATMTLSAPTAGAQQSDSTDIDKILAGIRPYKHDFFTRELKLSKDQAREFLTLYDAMENALMEISDETRELERNVVENTTASETEIEAAARATFEQKQREAQIELDYYEKFKDVLAPRQLLLLKTTERRFTQKLARSHRKLLRERAEK